MYCITSGRDPENETVLVGKPGEEREEKAVNLLSSYVFDLAPGIRDAGQADKTSYYVFRAFQHMRYIEEIRHEG